MRTVREPTCSSVLGDAMTGTVARTRRSPPHLTYPEGVWTHEDDEDDEPVQRAPYVDGAWGRTANPNTADGELQNLAAFGDGLARLSGSRRTAAKIVVWLILIGVGLTIVYGVLGIIKVI
jgi:hypothetical protein